MDGPIIADAEAGFGGALNAFELTRAYIEAGVAGVHFEDQLASEKKCGHMGGKVLIPVQQHIGNLNAARLAADTAGVPTPVIARTDAESAKLITSDIDERDRPYLTGDRTAKDFISSVQVIRSSTGRSRSRLCRIRRSAVDGNIAPDLEQARRFAEEIRKVFPDKMLAYNCSPSFNWSANLDADDIARFQRELGAMGYKFQFITLAGFHSLNHSMYQLSRGYVEHGMTAYSKLQDAEFAVETDGYTAHRHQREVGAGWFDAISVAVKGGASATTALTDSTEEDQFKEEDTSKAMAS